MSTFTSILTPTLIPRQPVPALSVPLLSGGTWSLAEEKPENFTLVVFYRGIFCPICRSYLRELERLLPKFSELGVHVIAVSSDTHEGASTAKEAWKLEHLRLAYGLDLATAHKWGLFISKGLPEELKQFSEPGVFLVHRDGTLFFSAVQTMPFARPPFKDVIGAIQHILNANYPARGELVVRLKSRNKQAPATPSVQSVQSVQSVRPSANEVSKARPARPTKGNPISRFLRKVFRR